jgi:hypothetical protein
MDSMSLNEPSTTSSSRKARIPFSGHTPFTHIALWLASFVRPDLIAAIVIVFVAGVAIGDTYQTAGWTTAGPGSGFYPFWSAVMMGIAACIVLMRSMRAHTSQHVFESAKGLEAFLQVSVPMVTLVVLLPWFGFYLTSGVYMALFARWIGRYRWRWVGLLGVAVPLALFLTFEMGFKVPLPKSMFYLQGITPF